jgi:hypothetical protein
MHIQFTLQDHINDKLNHSNIYTSLFISHLLTFKKIKKYRERKERKKEKEKEKRE